MRHFTTLLVLMIIFGNSITHVSALYAHGEGASFETVVGDYFVDIGYSPPVIIEDTQTRLDFGLFDNNSSSTTSNKLKKSIPFDHIWLRIEDDQRLYFAGGLNKARFGDTGIAFSFPEAGEYTIAVRFMHASGTFAETSFVLPVTEAEPDIVTIAMPYWLTRVLLIGGPLVVAVLLISGLLLARRSSGRKPIPESPAEVSPSRTASRTTKKSFNLVLLQQLGRVFRVYFIPPLFVVIALIGGYFITTTLLQSILPQQGAIESIDFASAVRPSETNQTKPEIVLTEDGYIPREITIKQGTTVTFRNETGRPYWPASNLHPSHEIYPEFDPLRPLAADETWSFTFDKLGDWDLHDHIRSYFIGTIHVIP